MAAAVPPLENDVAIMLHSNCALERTNFQTVRRKGLRNWRVTEVVSPFEFYLEYVYEVQENKDMSLYNDMQTFYQDSFNRETYKRRTYRVFKHRHYVWFQESTATWERVRVLDTNLMNKTALVFLVDVGSRVTVETDTLYEMKPEFYSFSAKAFKAQLADVAPIDGSCKWSEKSIEAFKNMVLGPNKIFHGVIIQGNILANQLGGPGEESMELLVILVEKNPEATCTVQAQLVEEGLAISTGISSSSTNIFVISSVPSCKFSLSDWEKYYAESAFSDEKPIEDPVDIDCLDDDDTITSSCSDLPEPEPDPVFTKKDVLHVYEVAEKDKAKNWDLPPAILKVLPVMKIMHIINPGCIYLQRASEQQELKSLVEALTKQVKTMKPIDSKDLKCGDFVTVSIKVGGYDADCWHRACIRQVLPGLKLVKVVLIDFGSDILYNFNLVRPLPDYFQKISGYAYRVHMNDPNFMPAGTVSWGPASSSAFPRYMKSWEAVNPNYFVWKWSKASTLVVTAVHQPVIYTRANQSWRLAQAFDVDLVNPWTQIATHPLLFNLLCTHGVSLNFAVKNRSEYYEFEPLSDVLVRMGYAVYGSGAVEEA